jgi:uncharacterized protein (DUF1697 family)
MKFVVLLRGINVGGKNIIKMTDLKKAVENAGFANVSTYIQSGNIIFESDENNISKIVEKLETSFFKDFVYNSLIIVKSYEQLKIIVSEVPSDWEKRNDLECYIAFIRGSISTREIMREIELKEDIDFIEAGEDVLYMSTLLNGLTRSRFTKLVTKKIYKDITIRNYNTARKLLDLME